MGKWKLATLVAAIALLGLAAPASAANGTVTVTATSVGAFSLSLNTSSVAFGTVLAPDGAGAGTGVTSYQHSDNGAYYVNNGTASNFAVAATVKSNKAWGGSVAVAENTGTAGMTVGGGSLR